MDKPYIIGVTGVARSGKDTFCNLLIEAFSEINIESLRIGLADRLKLELDDFLHQRTGIDAFTEDSREKELIRPLMVAYGTLQRFRTNGKYWTDHISSQVRSYKQDGVSVIIPDIRFVEYEDDEFKGLKSNGGILVYISRYVTDSDGNKKYIPPANSDESTNSRILHGLADYYVDWESSEDLTKLRTYVDNFICYLHKLG